MALSKQELFEKLLEQVDWQPNAEFQEAFKDAAIDQVEVHVNSHRWDFHLKVNDILPFNAYQDLANHVAAAFKEIAATRLIVETEDPEVTNHNLADYWEWAVTHSEVHSPMIHEVFRGKVPYLDHKRPMIVAENEVIKDFLTTKALGPIEEEYQRLGFPKMTFATIVDDSKSQEKNQRI